MNFTPIAPTDLKGMLNPELIHKADEVILKSAMLEGSHSKQILRAVKDLLYSVNSYYSNRIESEGTHIIDIEKAIKKEYSSDTKERNLQLLSLAYIEVQKECELYLKDNPNKQPYDKSFIKKIHKSFYEKEGMQAFLNVSISEDKVIMVPGQTRERNVKVGKHEAPDYSELESLLNSFELLYKKSISSSNAENFILALSSHHRITWIHPFLDGNGRSSRLLLDSIFSSLNMQGYGLWNISRGLARDIKGYKEALSHADIIQQGSLDGKGPLSAKALYHFVEYMLDIALDQIEYMSECLKLDMMSTRMEKYILRCNDGMFENEDPLPKYTDKLFNYLLLKGECKRGEVAKVMGIKDRTASRAISELLKRDFIESDSRLGSLRLKIKVSMSSYLFPSLVPEQ
ncbi:MAG: Fic family protein [Helicobacteraceae bacterium]|nr:Fic family protein [Helicobacteraceae bacterium]